MAKSGLAFVLHTFVELQLILPTCSKEQCIKLADALFRVGGPANTRRSVMWAGPCNTQHAMGWLVRSHKGGGLAHQLAQASRASVHVRRVMRELAQRPNSNTSGWLAHFIK